MGADLENGPHRYSADLLPERLWQPTPAAEVTRVIVADFGLGPPPFGLVAGADKVHGDNLFVLDLTEGVLFDDFRIAVGVSFPEAIAKMEPIRDRIHLLIQYLQTVRLPEPVSESPGYRCRSLMLLRPGRHEGPQARLGVKTRLEPRGIAGDERGNEFGADGRHFRRN